MGPGRLHALTATWALTLCLAAPLAQAGEAISLSGELNLVAGHSDVDGWITEILGSQRNSAGFEYYRRFAGERGDFLTVDLQMRVSYDSESASGDDWGVEVHNAWAEYKLGLGRNLVLGHFSPAHGLEPVVDTHGTLLQTLAMQDVGFKKDWGAGYRGILGPYDLSVAGQLGSGMGIQTRDGGFLATAQIWTPPGEDFRYGLSLLAGRVLPGRGAWTVPAPDYADATVAKTRAGAAAVYSTGSVELRGELSVGKNDDAGAGGALLQASFTPARLQELTLDAQGRAWSRDLSDSDAVATTVTAGGSFAFGRNWTARAYVAHDVERPGRDGDTRFVAQLYYFGG